MSPSFALAQGNLAMTAEEPAARVAIESSLVERLARGDVMALDEAYRTHHAALRLRPDDGATKAASSVCHSARSSTPWPGSAGFPVFHHREDRIRAHVQLCWLALLLIRVAENAAGDTWCNIRHELDRMHLVTLATADGRAAQRSVTTAGQQAILHALGLPEPPKFLDFAQA